MGNEEPKTEALYTLKARPKYSPWQMCSYPMCYEPSAVVEWDAALNVAHGWCQDHRPDHEPHQEHLHMLRDESSAPGSGSGSTAKSVSTQQVELVDEGVPRTPRRCRHTGCDRICPESRFCMSCVSAENFDSTARRCSGCTSVQARGRKRKRCLHAGCVRFRSFHITHDRTCSECRKQEGAWACLYCLFSTDDGANEYMINQRKHKQHT